MKRMLISALMSAALVMGLAGHASAEKLGYFFGFDVTTDPWLGRAHSTISNTDKPALDMAQGGPVLRLYKGADRNSLAGLSVMGTAAAWMQAEFPPAANRLHVAFDVVNLKDAGRLAPIIYVAQGEPATLYDFQKIGYSLDKGRQRLQLDVSLEGIVGSDRPVIVALGFMNLDGLQTEQVGGIDNVAVTLYDGPMPVMESGGR